MMIVRLGDGFVLAATASGNIFGVVPDGLMLLCVRGESVRLKRLVRPFGGSVRLKRPKRHNDHVLPPFSS